MSAAFWRTGVAAVLAYLVLAPTEAGAKILLITHGDTITHLGDIGKGPPGAGAPATGQTVGVGYKWSYGGLFWIDFWTWGGEYCLHVGDKYEPITAEQAGILLGRTSPPSRPFLYKFPLGLMILGGIAVLAVIGKVVSGRAEKAADDDADLDQYRKGKD